MLLVLAILCLRGKKHFSHMELRQRLIMLDSERAPKDEGNQCESLEDDPKSYIKCVCQTAEDDCKDNREECQQYKDGELKVEAMDKLCDALCDIVKTKPKYCPLLSAGAIAGIVIGCVVVVGVVVGVLVYFFIIKRKKAAVTSGPGSAKPTSPG
jgi:hypothetical protein